MIGLGVGLTISVALMAGCAAAAESMTADAGAYRGGAAEGGGRTRYEAGLAAYEAGRFADAAKAFGLAVKARPGDADAWYQLGQALSRTEDVAGAVRAFERSIKLDAAPVAPRRDLALALTRLRQDQKARSVLEALKGEAAACASRCPRARELDAAVAWVEQALGVVPPSASTRPPPDDMKYALRNLGGAPA